MSGLEDAGAPSAPGSAVAGLAPGTEPPPDCPLCPRLAAFRAENRRAFPTFYNAPVRSFGPANARLLVAGLAPGLKGANRTGRPFTGDHAGDLLFRTLGLFGFAHGRYDRRPDDGMELVDCRIVNAVRCVPPLNKPTGSEVDTCRRFLIAELGALPRLRAVVALGAIAHGSVLAAFGLRPRAAVFGHGAVHDLPGGVALIDSYHCSRQNTNTGRLTPPMFEAVFAEARRIVGPA